MRIGTINHVARTSPLVTRSIPHSLAPAADTPSGIAAAPWTNPAATAALRSSVQILASIEEGIVQNFAQVDKVLGFAADLRTTTDIFQAASDALLSDTNKDNDQFLPLIGQAGSRVTSAEGKLSSKDITSTWPSERATILEAVRHARVISSNVADQLDPFGAVPKK